MANNLTSAASLAYQGTNAASPSNVTTHRNRPTPNFYQGFSNGDFWIYRPDPRLNTNELWVLMGVAGNVADWVLLTGSVGSVTDLQADDGNVVTPTLGIINIHGGSGIVTTGTVGPNTVTISTAATVPQSFPTDSGTATPAAGVLDIFGDSHNVTTTGSGHQVVVGLTGITQHSLQVGGASNALTQLGVATNGQLPIGSTGADPVLATLTAGTGITVTNGAGSITIAAAGTDAQSFPTDSGTATPSSGVLNVNGNGAGGSISTTGSGNTVNITDINKPAFLATCNSDQTNVTGDGTFYLVQFQNAVYNTSSSYNTGTGVFTAPINGIYYFSAVLGIRSLTVSFTQASIFLNSTAAGYQLTMGNIGTMRDTNNQISMVIDGTIPMSAGDTASIQISIAGSTKTLGVSGSSSPWTTWFSGYLMKVT